MVSGVKMMKKKGDISVGIMILAAIGLLVLIIMVIVFSGKTKVFTREGARCETNGGKCVPQGKSCSDVPGYTRNSYTYGCVKKGSTKYHCCMPSYTNEDLEYASPYDSAKKEASSTGGSAASTPSGGEPSGEQI